MGDADLEKPYLEQTLLGEDGGLLVPGGGTNGHWEDRAEGVE